MTLKEIFDTLRSQGDINYFGITVQEAFHEKPVLIVHEQVDLAQAEREFSADYNNETLTNTVGNATIVGYGFGESRDLKLVEVQSPHPATKGKIKKTEASPKKS